MNEKILIVDDDQSLRWVLKKAFENKGYNVSTASGGEEGLSFLGTGEYGVALVDIMMPDISGLELLQIAKERHLDTSFIVMTAQNTMKNAVEAMKCGAYDYITKPFDIDEIEVIARKAFESKATAKISSAQRVDRQERYEVGKEILGKAAVMQKIYKTVGKVSKSNVTVLIQGESGTGKELIAKAIHYNSDRADKPFVAVNSAAIPRELLESELFGHEKGAYTGATTSKVGKFEAAQGGSIFLDEIGDMSQDLQAKLLRVLQEREIDRVGGSSPVHVDVRVIAATNKDIQKAVNDGEFREDLYYRLNVVNITMPPLRKRKGDIPLLVDFFLDGFTEELKQKRRYITEESMKMLTDYSWPGNVRELENTIRRMIVLSTSSTIMPEDLPSKIRNFSGGASERYDDMSLEEIMRLKLAPLISTIDLDNTEGLYSMVLKQMERPLIRLVLEKCKWNQIKASKVLGINRNTLKKKMDTLEIRRDNGK